MNHHPVGNCPSQRGAGEEAKSPACPKCGERIDTLVVAVREISKWTYYFDGEEYTIDETEVVNETFEYQCPYCYATLATTEEEAKKILGYEEVEE